MITGVLERLHHYIEDTINSSAKNFNSNIRLVKSEKDCTTKYKVVIDLANFKGLDDKIIDTLDQNCPVDKNDIEQYLINKLYLKSLLFSKLSIKDKLPTEELYMRKEDKKVFELKLIALDEQTNRRWCVLNEQNDKIDTNYILIPLEKMEDEYSIIPKT